jgi:hypothetical protein
MTQKVKYRIVVRDSHDYPFVLERRTGFFRMWKAVDVYGSMELAENDIADQHAKFLEEAIPPVGTVVKTYAGEDLTAIVLRG